MILLTLLPMVAVINVQYASEIGTFSYESMPAGSNNDIDVSVIIDCDPEIDYHIEIQANNDGFTNDEVNHIVYDIASI